MKLLCIYGPPAAGKLTVAGHIADNTDFRLFHNHLTIDLVRGIFEDRKLRINVTEKLRLDVFEAAAKANINLIFTMVYGYNEDADYVRRIVTVIEHNGGEVCFVQLIPDVAEVERRVTHASRQAFSKIKDLGELRRVMVSHDLYGAVPFPNNLPINNTDLTPAATAQQIIDHFQL